MTAIYLAQDFTSCISQIISPSLNSRGGLYLGNLIAAQNQYVLKKYSIKAIISILSEKDLKFSLKNCSHLKISIEDSPFENISDYFGKAFDFITKNIKQGNVFVHCVAGISRSATIVIGYLMKTKKYSFQKALIKVKRRRSIIYPNKGFMNQLKAFQKKLQNENKKQDDLFQKKKNIFNLFDKSVY